MCLIDYNPPDSDNTQIALSEELQLLALFNDDEYLWAPGVTPGRKYENQTEAGMLDALALFIAGQSGPPLCHIAAVLHRQHPISFVLAKKEPLTLQDKANAKRLFVALFSSKTESELLSFVISSSRAFIQTRLNKVAKTDLAHIQARLQSYRPGPVNREIDTEHDSGEHLDVKEIITRSMEQLRDCRFRPTEPIGTDSTLEELSLGIERAAFLSETAFIKKISLESTCHPTVTKYVRRLDKLAQFQKGVQLLFNSRNRFGSTVSWHWIESSMPKPTFDTLRLSSSPLAVAQRVKRPDDKPVTASILENINDQIFESWVDTITPTIHPEILLLIYCCGSNECERLPAELLEDAKVSREDPSVLPDDFHILYRSIGCSKRSCQCCDEWIRHFNEAYKVRWETSQIGGKYFLDWALTGFSQIDDAVRDFIAKDIQSQLCLFVSFLSLFSPAAFLICITEGQHEIS